MKIYQLKVKEGMFLNLESKNPFYTPVFWRASYFSSAKVAQQIIDKSGNNNLIIHETTEQEFTEAIATETTNVSIQMDSLAVRLERIAYSLPTMSGLNKQLKNFLTNTSVKLKKANPQFTEFLSLKEDATYDIQGIYDELINNLSFVNMWEVGELNEVLKAYKKDKSSVLGIAKKVNKNGNQ